MRFDCCRSITARNRRVGGVRKCRTRPTLIIQGMEKRFHYNTQMNLIRPIKREVTGAGYRTLALGILAVLVIGLQGCFKATVLSYETLIRALDGKSELYISTYPSDIARSVSGVPFLWKEVRSPNSVYFEVFVREVGRMGRNPHVESITIHSFSYAFPGQAPVQLIADYDHNFWQQGSPKYNPDGNEPVLVHEAWYVNLEIDLTLNGQRYRIEDRVHAVEKESMRPLLLEAFR